MKKIALTAALLLTTLSASADRPIRDRGDLSRNGLRVCQQNLADTRARLSIALDDLQLCQERRSDRRHGNRGDLRRLRQENQRLNDALNQADAEIEALALRNSELAVENDRLFDENERLKRVIDDIRNPPRPDFDLASAIRACSEMGNAAYSRVCAQKAKEFKIKTKVIKACTKMNNEYYALECVKNAGALGARAPQVNACVRISNVAYANSCVKVAAERNVRANIINSCIDSTSNEYYQLECVKDM